MTCPSTQELKSDLFSSMIETKNIEKGIIILKATRLGYKKVFYNRLVKREVMEAGTEENLGLVELETGIFE
jgi:hypothetical protein